MKKVTLLTTYFLFTCLLYANNADSLLNVVKKWESKNSITADTTLYNVYYELGKTYQSSSPDTAIYYLNKAKDLSKKLNKPIKQGEIIRNIALCLVQKGSYEKALTQYNKALILAEKENTNKKSKELKSATLGNIGVIYMYQSDYSIAIDYFLKAMKINEEIGNKRGVASDLGNIGIVYMYQSEYTKALDYYLKALRINEEINNKKGIANNMGGIGIIYMYQSENSKALDYFLKAIKINEEIGNKKSVATNLGNIGAVYQEKSDYSKALEYYFKALKIDDEFKNTRGVAANYSNIGIIYNDQQDYSKALKYYFSALEIYEDMGDKNGVALNLGNIGSLYSETGKFKEAEEYLDKSITLCNELGLLSYVKYFENIYSDLDITRGNYRGALMHYKNYIAIRDTIESEVNVKQQTKLEMKYNYEKKTAIDSIAHNKEKEIKDAKIAQQQTEIKAKRNQQYALFGGMFLVIVFAGAMYNRFRVTRKQKVIIEEKERETHLQKEIIEEKHKEITDSINYAERIQRSFLATTEMLDENLNHGDNSSPSGRLGGASYFVFFRPKDVVSGDFYWAAKLNNGNFAFACADSTGHGVPGAIMSILNISSLEKSIETQTEPHKILHETRKIIINRLKKDGSAEGGKDGMDCSLLVLNQEKNQLTFASANNSVFIIRNSEIIEFKGDKMPVGKSDKADEIFTLHKVDLQKGDVIYSLTDGFPDQFGGNKGKKYMIKNLKNLLLQITLLPLKEQEQKLANEFDKWKGNEEQVDDVCIIGVRI